VWCLPRESAKMSITSQMHPYIWLSCKLKQWTGCAISSGVLFQSVFSRPNFLTFQHFSTHLEIHDNFVCVCVEMLFLKNFTRCCGQWNMVLKVMVWEWGIKRNNRGWLCENLANKKNLKSLLQSVSLTLKKKACKILNYKNH